MARIDEKTDNTNKDLKKTDESVDKLGDKVQENYDNTNKKLDDHGQRISDLERDIALLK